MPLRRISDFTASRMGIWQMTESIDELPRPSIVDLSDIHSEVRLKEKLTEYCLLECLTSRDDILIKHNSAGKPYLEGFLVDRNVSISHTRGWATMIVSSDKSLNVGVDIEYYADRVNKIADRFIRPDEQNTDLDHRLIIWSAKESVYKLFSEEDLQYFDMRVKPFPVYKNGIIEVEDLKSGEQVAVNYILNNDYVTTFAMVRNKTENENF